MPRPTALALAITELLNLDLNQKVKVQWLRRKSYLSDIIVIFQLFFCSIASFICGCCRYFYKNHLFNTIDCFFQPVTLLNSYCNLWKVIISKKTGKHKPLFKNSDSWRHEIITWPIISETKSVNNFNNNLFESVKTSFESESGTGKLYKSLKLFL